MKVVIVEDEIIAAQNLQKLIMEIRSDFQIETILQTVEESVSWFGSHPMPDLIFMDIHLADGSSFSIFDKINVDSPIIFTTAYDEYALEAFEVNGIDYLLKPINKARLTKAIMKFGNISFRNNNMQLIEKLVKSLDEKQNHRKTHFLVPHKDKLLPLAIDNIAFFYAEMKVAKAITFEGYSFLLDYSLDELMRNLNEENFFRVNRQYIVAHKAIKDISVWFMGKLAINLHIPFSDKIFVSRGRVPAFKMWYTRE
ncbi:LytR/AlgR family response regulator transcription factor [Parabacteroides timonensis]|uniref:LytR/AlgR family response regulator transcription factor n=1 Tax=Parabacteroides timonensis TaxID=1871013 RepID=UPI00094E0C4B|nr:MULTISPECIES: LytTR family DNA-binding domain-containing protein [Parabacteroides]